MPFFFSDGLICFTDICIKLLLTYCFKYRASPCVLSVEPYAGRQATM
ncbi:hypothetical protein TW89_0813 [Neisseria flavescens]|nr:hypothetical protein TW89_0813 [Neisseria flavescens]